MSPRQQTISLEFLGAPRIERNGNAIEVDTRKAVALLAYLAVSGQPATRDALAALFWPEADSTHARGALRRTLSALRLAVGDSFLDISRELVGLAEGADYQVDVGRFYALLEDCLHHGHSRETACSRCIKPLTDAADLYRGDLLEGFSLRDSPAFDEWQFFEAERLRQALAGALDRLVERLSRDKNGEAALEYARRRLALDPLHEPAHRQLIRLYLRNGQRSAAVRQYRECVRVLETELGVPPLEETTALYLDILENRTPEGEIAGDDGLPAPQKQVQSAGYPAAIGPYRLAGRQGEWLTLEETYSLCKKDGRLCIIAGETGIGKTRLAAEFLAQARRNGAQILTARLYPGESGLAYGPFIQALRSALSVDGRLERLKALPGHVLVEAARLLPELSALAPGLQLPPAEGPGAQTRLFEALRRLIAALAHSRQPGILFLDDLHWVDSASLDLLAYLIRRLAGFPVLILGALREEEIPAASPLPAMILDLQRAGAASRLILERLSSADVDGLAQEAGVPADLRRRLFSETDGLPYFVVEYLESAKLTPAGEPIDWKMPGSVRELQRSRLILLDETSRQLLAAAAVIGRSFDFETLRQVSGRSEPETVNGLESLVLRRLLVERSAGSTGSLAGSAGSSAGSPFYEFNHETLYQVVLDETSLARRRLLHRRTAESLLNQPRSSGGLDQKAAAIARHYQLAGDEGRAADYFRQAGEYARSLFANLEALAHFQAALALGDPVPHSLHQAIGDLRTLRGEYRQAQTAYETAAALADPDSLPGLEQRLGVLHHRRGDWELAAGHFESALDLLKEGEPAVKAGITADWSRTAASQGDARQALRLARRSLKLAEEAEAPDALAQAHNILGILSRQAQDLALAQKHLEKALAYAGKEPARRCAALNNLALVYMDRGEFERSGNLFAEALELTVRLGDRHRQAALLNHLADLHHAAGRRAEEMTYLKQAVGIFAEIGAEAGDLQPEIWKLTEW